MEVGLDYGKLDVLRLHSSDLECMGALKPKGSLRRSLSSNARAEIWEDLLCCNKRYGSHLKLSLPFSSILDRIPSPRGFIGQGGSYPCDG